jgi:O-antigen ligase
MFSRVNDTIGRSLIIVFLIKPLVDLTWFIAFPFFGQVRSPMHIFAGLVFLYLLPFRFRSGSMTPPYLRLFEVFLGLHLLALFVGAATNPKLTLTSAVDFMLRISNSYLIYYLAFVTAIRYQYRDVTPFVKAIVLGSTLPVIANSIAVTLDLDFGFYQPGISAEKREFREPGLYYDAGGLANMAFFHLAFSVFLMHLLPSRGKMLFSGFLLALITLDVYLISATHSRSFVIQLAIFGFIYLLMFHKGWGKLLAPVVAVGILSVATVAFDINVDELFVRFESESAALEGEAEFSISSTGEVSFGSLEGLGSNRGALWAAALTRIFKRSGIEILFGNFTGSIAHSDYIDVLARTGIVGLLVYLSLIIGMTLRSWRNIGAARSPHDRTISFMAFILLICYVAYSLPFRPLGYTTTSWYMWMIIAFAMARARLAPLEATAAAKARAEDEPPPGAESPEPDPENEEPEFPARDSRGRNSRGPTPASAR